MTWRDLDGDTVTAAASPLESRRFGIAMGRVVVGNGTTWDDVAAAELAAACRRTEEILVVRWPSLLADVPALLAASGREISPADTLVYWEVATGSIRDAVLPGAAMEVMLADALSSDALDDLVRTTFEGYVNHYSVNPRLHDGQSLEGYVEWVRSTAEADSGAVAVLCADGHAVGLVTSYVDPDGGFVEILLAGLVPGARARGWYAALLAHVAETARDHGIERMIISTQAGNVAVQRAWVRAGFRPFAAFATAHAVLPSPRTVG